MRRLHLLAAFSILLGLSACAASAADSPRTAQPDPRLDKKTLAADQATVDRAIAELKDLDSAKREQAAATLRRLVAKYPSHTVYLATDDGGRAAWQKKIARIKVGMTRAEVLKIAPHFHAGVGGAFGGRNFFEFYTLDYHWKLNINYTGIIGKDDTTTVLTPPVLIEQVMEVFMPGPAGFTGVWTTWYVTGEKARDVQYDAGQPHGVETWFYPNGHKCEEDHYVHGVRTGAPIPVGDPTARCRAAISMSTISRTAPAPTFTPTAKRSARPTSTMASRKAARPPGMKTAGSSPSPTITKTSFTAFRPSGIRTASLNLRFTTKTENVCLRR